MSTEFIGKDAIDTVLSRLARQHGITIVAVRDIGSRAWNLASERSDYDVGFLYAQPASAYAMLGTYQPTIETSVESHENIELSGWNVTRFGALLADSNPTALEFLHSPLRYRESDALATLETAVAGEFTPITLYHHYRSLAERNYRKYIQRRLLDGDEPAYIIEDETPELFVVRPVENDGGRERITKASSRYTEAATDRTVKRNLYVIRAVLYAQYIRDTHEYPTLDFPAFLDENADRFDSATVEQARTLVERKRRGEGTVAVGDSFGPDTVTLDQQIDPEAHNVRGISRERVNTFIQEVVT